MLMNRVQSKLSRKKIRLGDQTHIEMGKNVDDLLFLDDTTSDAWM